MTSDRITERLRLALLLFAAFTLLFTVTELWLTEHVEDAVQLIPFALSGLGLIAIAAALLRPSRATLWALRGVMALLILGSLFGMYEHLAGNFGFELEIRPNAGPADVIWEALKGANPLLAPGILAFAGVLALLASYYHPALQSEARRTGTVRAT